MRLARSTGVAAPWRQEGNASLSGRDPALATLKQLAGKVQIALQLSSMLGESNLAPRNTWRRPSDAAQAQWSDTLPQDFC